MRNSKMYRVEEGRMILGVCGGVAEYFAMNPNVVRVLWAVLALSGPAAIAYLIAAAVLPNKSRLRRP